MYLYYYISQLNVHGIANLVIWIWKWTWVIQPVKTLKIEVSHGIFLGSSWTTLECKYRLGKSRSSTSSTQLGFSLAILGGHYENDYENPMCFFMCCMCWRNPTSGHDFNVDVAWCSQPKNHAICNRFTSSWLGYLGMGQHPQGFLGGSSPKARLS